MEPVAPTLCLQLFGPFQARLNNQPLSSPTGRKVLAYLALKRGRESSHTELADALWPTSAVAAGNLSRVLLELRKTLGGRSNPYVLAPTRHTLRLNGDAVAVDLLAFEHACQRADPTALQRALALYTGPLLQDWTESWVLGEREACQRRYVQALEALRAGAMQQGNVVSVRECLRRLRRVGVVEEAHWRELLQTLLADRDYATATRVFDELNTSLRAFNRTPDPTTRALSQQIPLRARGRPERPARPSHVRSHLPFPLTELIGREAQVQELRGLLNARLVTLRGTGGVGKTCLAIHLAHRVADRYAHGAWFIDLSAVTASSLLLPEVASGLGLRETAGQSVMETVSAHLRSRHLLLVLDNCEHLVGECASLAHRLLKHCPNLHILATSRQALQTAGEVVWRVPSLAVPDPGRAPMGDHAWGDPLEACAAVRLFVARARQHEPTFELTQSNGEAVATICRRLDGIPLAIELAAAWVGCLSVEAIQARLDARFELLTGGDRAALPRQQTLRATIDWSYALLSEQERWLFVRQSVFAGGWTLAAAEVCAGEGPGGANLAEGEVLGLLKSLVDKSLVDAVALPGSAEAGNSVRYRMLETIHCYAWDRLVETGQSEGVRRRHRDYFLARAEEAEPHLKGAKQIKWLQRLEAEHDNLNAALDRSLSDAGQAVSLRFCWALHRFWYARGHLSEGLNWCMKTLQNRDAQEQTSARAKALNAAGLLAYYQGEYVASVSWYQEGEALCREIADKSGLARSLYGLGLVVLNQGDPTAARTFYEESQTLCRQIEDRVGVACALNGLGSVAEYQGDYALARSHYEECVRLFRELGDQSNLANSLKNLGSATYFLKSYVAARPFVEESLSLFRESENQSGIAYSLSGLGLIDQAEGLYELACLRFEESLVLQL